MSITNLIVKLPPEEIPWYMLGKFFELHTNPNFNEYDENGKQLTDSYAGWVHIREDGTIEFGEPGA